MKFKIEPSNGYLNLYKEVSTGFNTGWVLVASYTNTPDALDEIKKYVASKSGSLV